MGRGGKKAVMKVGGVSFRDFKSKLTCKYILPFRDNPEKLEHPPTLYNNITQTDWNAFVADRLDPMWDMKHKVASERRAHNKYNHRVSRKGYVGLEEELVHISNFC